ncbi:CBS domain-containing protein [Neptunomonas japonica]|uniref:CBS domain-containing protein n=1 Tax=Neptunomonas japonica TaxID=417574 RepID=UPI000422C830|nr:CBS domain-containing protein [Neptunomonas japonica]
MALLIYDNGNLVKNPSAAQFPQRGVAATSRSTAAKNSLQNNTVGNPQITTQATSVSSPLTSGTRSTLVSSRLYEETGRKSDTLQDRRRLIALHIMNAPVVTVGQFDTIKFAWDLMQKENINHLIITNAHGHPLGAVTGEHLLRSGSDSSGFVGNLLSSALIAVSPETLVREIALIFMEQKVSCVPVVDQEHKVVGIVCRSDLLSLLVSGPNLEQRV